MPIPESALPAWNGVAPVAILDRVRRLNRGYLNPVIRRIAGRLPGPLVLLRHRGRISGRMYVTPLIAQRTPGGYVIPLTYGDRADWVKNVLASGRAEIRKDKTTYAVSGPVIVDDRAALPLLAPMLRLPVRVAGIKRFMTLATDQSRLT
jgi:deazaflavin-dependent oxidoreductase (nitroreductase family)